ncbi:MAG: hypothetical protein ACP5IB_03815 [Thermoplasmata archaeon]
MKFGKLINTPVKEKILREIILQDNGVSSISRKVGVSAPAVFKNLKLFQNLKIIKEVRSDNNLKSIYKINIPLFGIFYLNDYSLYIREFDNFNYDSGEKNISLNDLDKMISKEIENLLFLLNLRNIKVHKLMKEINEKNLSEFEKRIIQLYLSGEDLERISKEMKIDINFAKESVEKFLKDVNEL